MTTGNTQRINKLEELIRSRQNWLFRFAYMRTGNRADAEDIVQNVFLKVFQSLNKLVNVEELESYLLRSVSNACKDYYRKKRPDVVSLSESVQVPDKDDDSGIHDEYLRICRLLDALPPEQSEVIRLKCYDGLTFKEIAMMENIPEATAKSRYRYGITNIQNSINHRK